MLFVVSHTDYKKNNVFAVVKVRPMTFLPNKIPANQHFQSTFLICRKAWKLPRHSVLSFIGASFDCFELMLSLVRSFSLMYVSVHRLSRTDWISFPRDLPFQVSVKYISDSLERAQIDPSLPCFMFIKRLGKRELFLNCPVLVALSIE